MSPNAKMWIQIVGALFFVSIAVGEMTGLKTPTFTMPRGWIVFALAAAVMGFEAWRTWRKSGADTTGNNNRPDAAADSNGTK